MNKKKIEINKESLTDDDMIKLINENFTEKEMDLFKLNYQIYTENKNNTNSYVVNLDNVYKWIGFNTKGTAKRLLIKYFEDKKDYIINKPLDRPVKRLEVINGGQNKEEILLTINCFKKFCMKANTKEADNIYNYYIKLEDVMTKYVEIKQKRLLEEKEILLQIKDNEYLKIIENKDKIIKEKDVKIKNIKEIKYDEAKKVGTIYLLSTDKENIIKCGRTKQLVEKRVSSIQTGSVEDIKILYEYKTCDDVLLESIVHNILSRYRLNSNREHFSCNLEYMKAIIEIIGETFDILKSTYEHISRDEILYKINKNLFIEKDIKNIINKNHLELNKLSKKKLNKEIIKETTNIISINQAKSLNINNIQDKSEEKIQEILESLNISNNEDKNQDSTNENRNIININQDSTNENRNIININQDKKRIERICDLCNLKVFGNIYHLTRHQTSSRCAKIESKRKNSIKCERIE